jgi:hypothetical protein
MIARKWMASVLGAAVLLVAAVAFAAPATASGHGAMIARNHAPNRKSCSSTTECISWTKADPTTTSATFQDWWTINANGWQLRARARCVDRASGSAHYNYGNFKTAYKDRSRSTCYSPYVLVQGCEQWRKGPGFGISTYCPYPALKAGRASSR